MSPREEATRSVFAVAGIAVTALAAASISFASLLGLGRLAGLGALAWLLPFAVDGYTLTATHIWLRRGNLRRDRIARWARGNALAAYATSVAANVADRGLAAAGVTSLSTGYLWIVAAAVASVAPVMLGLSVHLLALISAEQRATLPRPPAAGPAPEIPQERARARQRSGSPARVTPTSQARDYARTRHDAGYPVTAPELTQRYGVEPSSARKLVRALSNGRPHG